MREILKQVSLFADLNDDELGELEAILVTRSYQENTILVSEGDRGDTLFVILEGQVKVFVSAESDKELVLGTQGPGDYFGEMILDEGPRSASVMTIQKSRVAVLTRKSFRDYLTRYPDVAIGMIGSLIRRCRALTENSKDLALMDVYGRLSKLLLSLASEEDGRLVIHEKLTKQAIGDRIGASREMVSRIFKDLTAGGYIGTLDGRMVIRRKPPANW